MAGTKSIASLKKTVEELDFIAAQGKYNLEVVDVTGWQPIVGTSLIEVWDLAAAWVAPTTARLHDLDSTSVEDIDTTGDGIRQVLVEGLSATYAKQSETVLMDGTDAVATANTYTMINKITATVVGSVGTAAGIITATAQTDATVTAQIVVGQTQTFSSVYVVPLGYEAYVVSEEAFLQESSDAAGDAEVTFLTQSPFGSATAPSVAGPSFRLDVVSDVGRLRVLSPYTKLAAKTKISVKAIASHITTDVITRVRLILDLTG